MADIALLAPASERSERLVRAQRWMRNTHLDDDRLLTYLRENRGSAEFLLATRTAQPAAGVSRASPSRHRLAITLMLILGLVTSAQAQMGGGRRGQQKNQQQSPQTSSTPAPSSSTSSDTWPRLDVGAILCSSRDDLIRYQALNAGGGAPVSGGNAPDCHVIHTQTGIEILDRDGPSRTQVATTADPKLTGWTNSYLPSTPPASASAGSGWKK
jgi:hypothetical protein